MNRWQRAWKAFRGKRTDDYKAAVINRLVMDWVAGTKSSDQEISGNLRLLRARARELARNDANAKHYLRLLVTNVVGPKGMTLQAQVAGNDGKPETETNRRIEAGWNTWAGGAVTVDGKQNFRQLQVMCLRAMARDGEVFVRLWRGFARNPHGLALQAIDADMLDETFNRPAGDGTNEIRLGVEVDTFGAPVAYHFFSHHQQDIHTSNSQRKRIRVPASEILHLYDCDRPNQTRGVTWLHATMMPIRMLGGYEEAELVAARTAAAKMGFITKPETYAGGAGDGEEGEWEASPGSIEDLPAGWKFEGWDPQHPSTAFPNFVKSVLRRIASALGVSYNTLANDGEGVTYSTLRSMLLCERDYWRTVQADWVDALVQPVFREWLNMALLHGALQLKTLDATQYQDDVRWQPRGWAWVDPQKEVQAHREALALRITSRKRIAAERGEDLEEIFEELAREEELAQEMGLAMAPAAPEPPPKPNPEEDDEEETTAGKNGRHIRRF